MNPLKIGIDKLTLTGRDFSVVDAQNRQLAIDDRKKQGRQSDELPYLITDQRGTKVFAHSIYHNSTALNVSINQQQGINVSFNPSKLINPYQLSEINSDGFNQSIRQIDEHLQKIGIRLNIENLKLNRVDLAKQAEMQHEIFEYNPAFVLLNSKSTMKKRAFVETHTIGNTQHQACFYDKIQELHEKGLKNIMQGEKNLMRAEIRLMKSKSTQKILHCKSLKDFRQMDKADISEVYSEYMNKNIFNQSKNSEQMQLLFNDEVELYKLLKVHYPNKALLNRLALTDIDEYLLKVGGITGLAEILHAAGYNRMAIYRQKKSLQELINLKAQIDRRSNRISVSTLLHEIKIKFAA